MTGPLRVAVIIASTRQGRFGPVVGRWFAQRVEARGDLALDLIDLADLRLPDVLHADPTEDGDELTTRLTAADAFVVITPEYNHSFPAGLKHAIDLHYHQWQAKPVAFVSYGGLSGGLRAVEHLRTVFAELHAVTVRDTVSFHSAWDRFDAQGRPRDADQVEAAAKVLLDQLAWWAETLRTARAERPYAA